VKKKFRVCGGKISADTLKEHYFCSVWGAKENLTNIVPKKNVLVLQESQNYWS
jgi:hypothetical protein